MLQEPGNQLSLPAEHPLDQGVIGNNPPRGVWLAQHTGVSVTDGLLPLSDLVSLPPTPHFLTALVKTYCFPSPSKIIILIAFHGTWSLLNRIDRLYKTFGRCSVTSSWGEPRPRSGKKKEDIRTVIQIKKVREIPWAWLWCMACRGSQHL